MWESPRPIRQRSACRTASAATSSSRVWSRTFSTTSGSASAREILPNSGTLLHQPLLTLVDVLLAPLDQPVGERHHRVAGVELDGHRLALSAGDAEWSAVREGELLGPPVGSEDHGRRVPRVGRDQLVPIRVEHHVDHRDELGHAVGVEQQVELLQQDRRGGVDGDEGADRGPRLGHCSGSRDPSAHHVTDEHRQPAFAQVERVEEVTADLGAAGRAVVLASSSRRPPR